MAAPYSTNRTSRTRDAMKHHEVLASGMLSGILGGIGMVAVAMIGEASQGLAPLHPLQLIGESFVGPEALDGAAAAKVAFGAIVHLATSIGLGILFAAIVPRDFPVVSAIGVGVGFGLFTLGFMMPAVVPWANPGFRSGMQEIGGAWVIAHAVFGAAVGSAPGLRRWIAPAASDVPAVAGPVRARAEPVARSTRTV